jgi:TRAP-type C4-dicarboxylate transport system permease small subunit
MRRLLDHIYATAGLAAAACLCGICLIVFVQVVGRILHGIGRYVPAIGAYNIMVPSSAEFAGFLLASATFLALAYTLNEEGHIRVSLFLQFMAKKHRRWFELWSICVGAGVCGYFLYYASAMALDSFVFNEVSYGIVPIPLWIPQTVMSLGLLILLIALADRFVRTLRDDWDHEPAAEKLKISGE